MPLIHKSLSAILVGTFLLSSAQAMEGQNGGYQIHTIKREAVPLSIDIAGTVAALKTAQLTAQIPGRIVRLAGEEGDRFAAGSELIQIDDSALRARLDSAHAQRNSALAALRNANVQLHREVISPRSDASTAAPGGMGMPAMMDQVFTNPMQNMMGMRSRGSEINSDLINRETQLTQANTQLSQANAQIREIQSSLRDARTLAPFDGVIESLQVEQGDTVQPGQPLLSFSETSGYQVNADVPVRVVPGLREGMKLPVRIDGRGPSIPARIGRIFPVADATQHTVRIEMDLPIGTRTTVGQYVEVKVPDAQLAQQSTLLIPKNSVIRKGGLPLVFTVGDDGKTRLRVVRLGEEAGADAQVVLSGVREGDRILGNPPPGMRAGIQVDASTASQQQ